MYDAISQVTELEEKVYVQLRVQLVLRCFITSVQMNLTCSRLPRCLQKVNDFVTAMEQTSYNIKSELPGLLDHSRKVLGLYRPQLDFPFCHFGMKSYPNNSCLTS